MTTTMRRQLCLVLVGTLVFVTRKTDCFAIHSDETRGVDSMESHELFPYASTGEIPEVVINTQQLQADGKIMPGYSDEHDDFSVEQVHVGAILGSADGQLAPTPTTNNGPAGQVTGLVRTASIRYPVSIHSDEHDNFSDEVSLVGVSPNTQSAAVPMAPAAGQEPTRGKRIFKQPDERHIVSARPGKQVIIRSGATPGSPIQTTSIHKATYRHSDEDDDYSDEVGSVLAPPATQNVPVSNAGRPVANMPPPVYRLRPDQQGDSLPWREGDDDVHVQIDPVTKQVVNIRTELRDSREHGVYFPDVIIGSRIAAPPTPVSTSVNTNGNVRAPSTALLVGNQTGQGVRLISQHSDEHDTSLEWSGPVLDPARGVRVISRHSDEYDDTSLEAQLVQTAPGRTGLLKHSDEYYDTSLEVAGPVLSLQNGQLTAEVRPAQAVIPGQHWLSRNSDEVDDISLEFGHVTSGVEPPITAGGIVDPAAATGVQHGSRYSSDERDSVEHEDLSLEVDVHLLPEIQRLFTNVRVDGALLPEVQSRPAAAAAAVLDRGSQPVQRMSRLLKQNASSELLEILANPVFQQKIQEIDRRLKSAPDSRGKRLIEKYAEALALSSPASFSNAAPSTISSCSYLSLLITWVSLYWLL